MRGSEINAFAEAQINSGVCEVPGIKSINRFHEITIRRTTGRDDAPIIMKAAILDNYFNVNFNSTNIVLFATGFLCNLKRKTIKSFLC